MSRAPTRRALYELAQYTLDRAFPVAGSRPGFVSPRSARDGGVARSARLEAAHLTVPAVADRLPREPRATVQVPSSDEPRCRLHGEMTTPEEIAQTRRSAARRCPGADFDLGQGRTGVVPRTTIIRVTASRRDSLNVARGRGRHPRPRQAVMDTELALPRCRRSRIRPVYEQPVRRRTPVRGVATPSLRWLCRDHLPLFLRDCAHVGRSRSRFR